MRTRTTVLAFLLFGLAACVAHPVPEGVRAAAMQWVDLSGNLNWPGSSGFAEAPTLIQLPEGMLIDRFGSEKGHFFAPKGTRYSERSLPYICEKQLYAAFRVTGPLLVWSGRTVSWFGEPGGGTRFETDAGAAQLVADGILAPLPPHEAPPPCN